MNASINSTLLASAADKGTRRRLRKSQFYLLLDWLIILSCLGFAAHINNGVFFFICALIVARQLVALETILHEASHGLLHAKVSCNDRLAQVLISSALLYPIEVYRRFHFQHHHEPDKKRPFGIQGYPETSTISARIIFILQGFILDMSGVSFVKLQVRVWKVYFSIRRNLIFDPYAWIVFALQINIYLLIRVCGGDLATYFILWLLPLGTRMPALLRVRSIFEHGMLLKQGKSLECARNFGGALITLLAAPHNVNYHREHHARPTLPCWDLPAVVENPSNITFLNSLRAALGSSLAKK